MKANNFGKHQIGLIGLLVAMAMNASLVWNSQEGLVNGASLGGYRSDREYNFKSLSGGKRKESIIQCLRNESNDGELEEFVADCSRDKGFDVKVEAKKVKTKLHADGKTLGKTSERKTAWGQKLKDKLADAKNDDAAARDADLKEVEETEFEITVAADTVPGCKTCSAMRSKTLRVSDGVDGIAELARRVEKLVLDAKEDIRDQKKSLAEEKRIEQGHKTCRNDESGERYDKSDEDGRDEYMDCLGEQVATLHGKDLSNLLNNQIFPTAFSDMFYNPEEFGEYMDMLSGHNGNHLVNGTFDNLNSIMRDMSGRDRAIGQVKQRMRGYPPSMIQNEISKVQAQWDDRMTEEMSSYGDRDPALGSQYMAIQQMVQTGRPPNDPYNTNLGFSQGVGAASMFDRDTMNGLRRSPFNNIGNDRFNNSLSDSGRDSRLRDTSFGRSNDTFSNGRDGDRRPYPGNSDGRGLRSI